MNLSICEGYFLTNSKNSGEAKKKLFEHNEFLEKGYKISDVVVFLQ